MAQLTVGRLSKLTGLEAKTLRYYDRVGLVRPGARTWSNFHLYGMESVTRVQFIHRAKAAGMSLPDTQRIPTFRYEGAPACLHLDELMNTSLREVHTRLYRLESLRRELRRLRRRLKTAPLNAAGREMACQCDALVFPFNKSARVESPSGGRPASPPSAEPVGFVARRRFQDLPMRPGRHPGAQSR